MMNQEMATASTHFNPSTQIDFPVLHRLLKDQDYEAAVDFIQDNQDAICEQDFVLEPGSYSRNIQSTDSGYWLSIIRWDNNAQTPIHGHPDQAFVYILSGELEINSYPASDLSNPKTIICEPNVYNIQHGKAECYDNAIHQISANKPSLSLHFYSDDPSKGEVFLD